eukprot:768096-Hanusia_phi.AAC.2
MSGGVLMSTEHKVTGGAEVSPKIAFEEKERAEEGGDVVPEYVDTESLAVGSLVVTSDSSLSNSMTQLHLSSSSASPLVVSLPHHHFPPPPPPPPLAETGAGGEVLVRGVR